VSKYTRELRDAGYLTVIAPVLTLTVLGRRTLGVNRYILASSTGAHASRRRAPALPVRSLPPGSAPPSDGLDAAPAPAVDHAAWAEEIRAILRTTKRHRGPP
jgi:hypothetical protein